MGYQWGYWRMRLKNSRLARVIMLAATPQLGMAGIHLNPFHHKHKPAAEAPTAPSDDQTTAPTPPSALPPQSPPDAQTMYDDVGYATPGITGGVSLAHPTLPQSSFVEVTNLDTGKTILAVVSAPLSGGPDIARLSPQAMTMLGAGQTSRIPVRVRRVSPPEQEQAALLNGRAAADRLDTPPFLLTALKRKLSGAQGQTPSSASATDDSAPATNASVKPLGKSTPKISSKPATKARPVAQASVIGDQRFVVEDGAGGHQAATRAAPATKTDEPGISEPATASTGALFIQIASFSSEASAKALATRIGAGARVEQAGGHWRVRTGPYANDRNAQAALGALAAKGYRDARVTH